MNEFLALYKRNVKLFFKDKGLFFTSLATPLILLVLYATFLSDVYRDSILLSIGDAAVSNRLLDGFVGGQLVSSILSVSCITVAFCSNMLMVQDKVTRAHTDFAVSPVRPSSLALGYYAASLTSTLIVCYAASALCFLYLALVGWYLSLADALAIMLAVLLLAMFGTSLSSVVNFFLSSQGQISAVGSIVSSCYGFISGAYMPISSFSPVLQKVIGFLPGTYGTVLLRSHAMRGAFVELETSGVPSSAVADMKSGLDCEIAFFGERVPSTLMFAILTGAVLLCILAYVLLVRLHGKKACKAS